MANIYYEKNCDQSVIKSKKILVIGYGSQGHAQAQNLRDSGFNVAVTDIKGSSNWKLAESHNWDIKEVGEAVKDADVIQILVPDQFQSSLYNNFIKENLKDGMALVFSHGFNIHFYQIEPPKNVDVFMVAPKGPGHLVRSAYEDGGGVPALVAVYQDGSGKAMELAKAYACGIGAGRAGIIETTFEEETETDLFGEQVVLCGGLTELIRAGFDTLVEAGYQPEIAYFECLHEVKLITDLIHEGGIAYMRKSISDTAEYGDLKIGRRIITSETRKEMKKVLSEIQSGEFAREWLLENQVNTPVFKAIARKDAGHLIEVVGAKLRSMMPWLKKKF